MTDPGRLNVLVVAFDSLSARDLAAFSNRLPVLNALARDGMVFDNAFSPSPESGPARASLFTGLDMAPHGVWTDGVALPDHETTFPERFAACGYRTWLVGRRHLAGVSHWTTEHARPGEFDRFDWAHGPLHRSRQNAYLTWLQETAPETYSDIFPRQPDPDDTHIPDAHVAAMAALPDRLCFNRWVGDRATALIGDDTAEAPFLGISGFVVGAGMGGAPPGPNPCEAVQKRALEQADAALGDILTHLRTIGLAERTVVLVTASRGSLQQSGESGAMEDGALRVPLVIRHPSGQTGSEARAVSTIDVAPTLYDLAKIPPPLRLQGASLWREQPGRGWALARLRRPDGAWQTALWTERFKLVIIHGDPDSGSAPGYQLYDLTADPGEAHDLAGSETHADLLEDMIDRMIDARVALEDRTEPRIAKF